MLIICICIDLILAILHISIYFDYLDIFCVLDCFNDLYLNNYFILNY
jgi:hypothetical protein